MADELQPEPFLANAPDLCRFAHVDLNSYFASVEQEIHPELRNRPVAVVPTMADTTCCIAASYEAKALGIKTGTQVAEARRICPEIVFIEGDHTVYAEYNDRIIKAVERTIPVIATPSIDEMVCEFIGREQQPANARKIALDIKQSIYKHAGSTLRCSIGLAPSRYLAKVASDMQKPDGLTVLLPSMLPHALEKLVLRDLPGVGARTEKRLNERGVRTMAQLLSMDREAIHMLWGSVWGDRMYFWLRGVELEDVGKSDEQKSFSHSHVLPPDLRTEEGAWAVAHKLLHKVGMRLRQEKFYCGALSLSIGYALTRQQAQQREREGDASRRHYSGIQNESWGLEAHFGDCQDTLTLLEAMTGIWQQRPHGEYYRKPFYVAINLSRLVTADKYQTSLFADASRDNLSNAMDKLNLKYGSSMLHFGGMMPARAAAPVRIAFTKIPVKIGIEFM